MVYRVVKKSRNFHYGDATDCMLKLVELGNSHKSKGGVFEMSSDKGGRLEILHWAGSLSTMLVDKFNDFIIIDGTRKTNIYDLSLIVTTTVDSLESSPNNTLVCNPINNRNRFIINMRYGTF